MPDVGDVQPGVGEHADRLRDRTHVHVGGDERLDERATTGMVSGASRHLLDAHAAAGDHLVVQHFRVRGVVALPHMFAHLDRGDGIEAGVGDLAVVLHADLHQVAEPRSAIRASMNCFCSAAIVTPTTRVP